MPKIIKIQKNYLIFRDDIKKIENLIRALKNSQSSDPVCLDFNNVNFISRSFADELLNFLILGKTRKTNVKIINLQPSPKKIIELVKRSKEKIKKEIIAHNRKF